MKLRKGDFVNVETCQEENYLGEYRYQDENFLCLKGDGEYIYIPANDVLIIRKPFVTVENPTA